MAKLKPNTAAVLNYLKTIGDVNVTAGDIADATGFTSKQVNAMVTMSLAKKNLAERVPAEIELEDGTTKAVKFIRLTELGKQFNPETDELV